MEIRENTQRVSLGVGSASTLYYGARAYVNQQGDTAIITCSDKDGTTTATVKNGTNGSDGTDGIGIESIDVNADERLVITLSNGEVWESTMPIVGENGADGSDANFNKVTATVESGYGTPSADVVLTHPVDDEGHEIRGLVNAEFQFHNLQGEQGIQGESGVHIGSSEPTDDSTVWIDTESGATVIPKARVEQTTNGAVIYCTDEDGTTTATIDTSDITRRLNALWDYSRGIVYDFETDDDDAYSKNVPSGGKVASVLKVGGKSVVVNESLVSSQTDKLINRGKNLFDASAEKVVDAYSAIRFGEDNTRYTVSITDKNNGADISDCFLALSDGAAYSGHGSNFFMLISNGTVTSSARTGTANLNQKYIAVYPPTEGTWAKILDRFNIQVEKGSTATAYTPYIEPQEIETNLPVLRSAGSVYDYVDIEAKKLHRRVGVVDLGEQSWAYSQANGWFALSCGNIGAKGVDANTVVANVLTTNYTTTSRNGIGDKCICVNTTPNILVKDSAYTSVSAFKTAMNGVMLYYELATEVITDITIPSGLDEMTVEANGSITFHNADDTLHLIVPNEVEYLVALAEVE